jgi:uncharacterized protein YabE (DUF348 family)
VRRVFTYGLLGTALIAAALVWAANALPQVIVARAVAKDVTITVDGQGRLVHTSADTVGAALTAADLTLGPHDIVAPSPDTSVADDSRIVVRRGRLLHLLIDGVQRDVWVTAPTVDQALADLGYDSTELSGTDPVSRSTRLPLSPTTIALDVPKQVIVTHDGLVTSVDTTAATVQDVLDELALGASGSDEVTPAPSTPVTDGLLVVIVRVTHADVTQVEPVAFASQQSADPTLDQGRRVVVRAGVDGSQSVGYSVTYLDGVPGPQVAGAHTVLTAPVDEIVRVGSKVAASVAKTTAKVTTAKVAAAPKATAKTTAAAPAKTTVAPAPKTTTPTPPPASAPAPPVTGALNWDAVAQCESSGNWAINTGNGYYGGLQFNASTWISNGGGVYAPTANLATKAQQIAIATKLYAARGAAPWPTCGKYI